MAKKDNKNIGQQGLLKDAPPPSPKSAASSRAAQRRKEAEAEKARRERQERIELLKMKQGIIEESEIIPETGYVEIPEQKGWAKFTNFLYHHRFIIIVALFFSIVAGICIYQFASKEKYDLYVLAISSQEKSEIGWRIKDIEAALEMYCEDFDGNGKVNVVVSYIDRTDMNATSEYSIMQAQKMTVEMLYGEGQMVVAEEKLWELLYPEIEGDGTAYGLADLSGKCEEDMLFKKCGLRVNKTGFADAARWKKCPDNICLFMRKPQENLSAGAKKVKQSHENALKVIDNIINGNIVNPPKDGE